MTTHMVEKMIGDGTVKTEPEDLALNIEFTSDSNLDKKPDIQDYIVSKALS